MHTERRGVFFTSKKMKIRKIADTVSLICLIGIFIFSSLLLIRSIQDYQRGENSYQSVYENVKSKNGVNFSKLRKTNPDVVAWLYLKGTKIKYPVVQGKDNEKYLHVTFDGTPSAYGTLFVDCRASYPFHQQNTIIYGHHMKDGSMFNNLKYFKDKSWAKKHRRFRLKTRKGKYFIKVIAFMNVKDTNKLYTCNKFYSEYDEQRFVNIVNKYAKYKFEEPIVGESYVSLSTCAYEFKDARYIVIGKLIPRF